MNSLCRDGSEQTDLSLPGHSMQFSAACCGLAQAIWTARRTAYDEPRHWLDLSFAQRQVLVLRAAWILTLQKRDTV